MDNEERSDWRDFIVASNRAMPRTANCSWTGPELPRVKAPISALWVGDDGRIWVRIAQPSRLDPNVHPTINPNSRAGISGSDRWKEPVVYDVIEPSGPYIRRVHVPDGVRLIHGPRRHRVVFGHRQRRRAGGEAASYSLAR
jgi:hypothetical protein